MGAGRSGGKGGGIGKDGEKAGGISKGGGKREAWSCLKNNRLKTDYKASSFGTSLVLVWHSDWCCTI